MLELRTLGGLALVRDGAPCPRAGVQRRQLAMLAVLAAAGPAGMSRERLAALLWPERDADRGRRLVDQALYAARRECGPHVVVATSTGVALDPAVLGSDLAAFTAALAARDLPTAVSRYGGPFLDGLTIHDAPEFEHWAEAERARLARLHVQALEGLARAASLRGDTADAVHWWRQVVDATPLSGRATRGLMEALAVAGDRSAALDVARVHEALVRAELDAVPEPEVTALVEALRASATSFGRAPAEGAAHGAAAGAAVGAAVGASAGAAVGAAPGSGPAAYPIGFGAVVEPAAAPPTRTTPTSVGTYAPPATPAEATPADAGLPGARPPATREPARRTVALRTVAAVSVAAAVLAGVALWSTIRGDADATPASAAVPSTVGPLSVVVLPFMDLSGGGARQAYFADGLTDELTATLSRLDGVRVLARTSAFSLRNRAVDVRQIGRTFAVTHVVEGTVRRTAARLRVTARLVDARTGYQLWAETFERSEGDVFRIEDDLAASIVRALSEHLGPGTLAALPAPAARTPVALPAYEDYLRGRYALHQRTGPSIEEARRLFAAVIGRDPTYAPAWSGLAMTAHLAPIYGYVSYAAGYDEAVRAAERAIALDSTLAEPWATLGLVRQRRYDWTGAIVAYREALRRDPNAATAHQWYGKALTQLGRYPEAEAEVRRALVLDPTSAVIRYNLGQLHFAARRYDEAAAALQAALATAPSFRYAHVTLGLVRAAQGRVADAVDEFSAAAADPSHTPDDIAVLAYGYAVAGQRGRARTLLAEAHEARTRDRRVSSADLAIAHMALGQRDSAFVWLDRAYEEHDSDLMAFATSPVLDPLRGDPRFAALRTRMRLPIEATPPTGTASR